MKYIFAFTILISSMVFANDTESRIAALENKIQALESVVSKKLGNCEMNYKFHSYQLNRCAEGTFARALTIVGAGAIQIECGYYQLQCHYSNPSNL